MNQRRQAIVWSGIVLLMMGMPTVVRGAEDPNLIGWWMFDEGSGTTAFDASGKGNEAQFVGNPQWVSEGRFGRAVQFNGTTDYLAAPDSASLDIKGDKLTLAAWVKANAWATSHFIRKIADTGTGSIYMLRVQANTLRAIFTTSAGALTVLGATTVRAQEWVHVAFVYDGAEGRVYLNGVVDGRGNIAGDLIESNNELRIGRGEPAGYFNGTIDDVRVYNRALTDAEIKALDPPQLQAFKPEPADGDRAVVAPLLRWTAGETGLLHNVYLGTSPDLGTAELVAARTPVPMYYHTPGLQPGTTYYWRVDEIELDGTTIHAGTVWSFTTQALTAYGPSPADGDTSVAPAVTLAWLPGKSALKHRVYLSDSRDAVAQGTTPADKGEQTQTTLAPAGLEGATTYYWRVDEILIDGTIQAGPVWSFTTFLLVDDFENYDDNVDAGTTIFDTWIDGWTNNTGSQVGNTTAPFAERTIVHGGKQAMPLDYNNVNAPFYSEAERDFATAQDWTVGDMTTLVLFVRGRAGNGPAPLYVAIRDATNRTATVVHPDAAVISAARWTEWKIPLEALTGVNPARIKRITLGLGDKAAPKPGGAGRIYLDDIRVTK